LRFIFFVCPATKEAKMPSRARRLLAREAVIGQMSLPAQKKSAHSRYEIRLKVRLKF
jgi:hypothetical protein